tara:strand:+ start:878 stop:1249 length:372 start_codon:yes stop_codon:yes gene_type:complete
MKVDTSRTGLEVFYPKYVAQLLKHIWTRTAKNPEFELVTREAFDYLQDHEDEEVHVSRASVIINMDALVEDGVLKVRQTTGKGGYHGVYSAALSPGEFQKKVYDHVETTLFEVFKNTGGWYRE